MTAREEELAKQLHNALMCILADKNDAWDGNGFSDEDGERKFKIKFTTIWQRRLFSQLMGLMRIERYGDQHANKLNLYCMRGESRLACHTVCTEEEWLELCAKYEVLKRDYKRQHDAFYRAFLIANDLLMPYSPDNPPSKTECDIDDVAESMAMGITKSKLHRQLEMKVKDEEMDIERVCLRDSTSPCPFRRRREKGNPFWRCAKRIPCEWVIYEPKESEVRE